MHAHTTTCIHTHTPSHSYSPTLTLSHPHTLLPSQIVVYKTSLPNKKLVFPCSQWLSRQQGDGVTQRVLRPSHTPTLTQRSAH